MKLLLMQGISFKRSDGTYVLMHMYRQPVNMNKFLNQLRQEIEMKFGAIQGKYPDAQLISEERFKERAQNH